MEDIVRQQLYLHHLKNTDKIDSENISFDIHTDINMLLKPSHGVTITLSETIQESESIEVDEAFNVAKYMFLIVCAFMGAVLGYILGNIFVKSVLFVYIL